MKLDGKQQAVLAFMKECHGDQQRKYEPVPYWTHPYAVAELANSYLREEGTIEIALCHDILEDTSCSEAQLSFELKNIGYSAVQVKFMMDGILGLTDVYTKQSFPDLNRRERKKLEAERLGKESPVVQSIKYADLADNAKSILAGDPGFAKVYLREMIDLLDQMRKGNVRLLIECCYRLRIAMQKMPDRF